jgi:hypothetical protein
VNGCSELDRRKEQNPLYVEEWAGLNRSGTSPVFRLSPIPRSQLTPHEETGDQRTDADKSQQGQEVRGLRQILARHLAGLIVGTRFGQRSIFRGIRAWAGEKSSRSRPFRSAK